MNISLSHYLGLDYVNHSDILPYISSSDSPIQHDLFKKFLVPNENQGAYFYNFYNNFE